LAENSKNLAKTANILRKYRFLCDLT